MGHPAPPKKILVSGGPPPLWGLGPPNALNEAFGGPRAPIEGRAPRPQNFFWEVQDVPIGPPEKIKWLVQLCHGFFEPYVIY